MKYIFFFAFVLVVGIAFYDYTQELNRQRAFNKFYCLVLTDQRTLTFESILNPRSLFVNFRCVTRDHLNPYRERHKLIPTL